MSQLGMVYLYRAKTDLSRTQGQAWSTTNFSSLYHQKIEKKRRKGRNNIMEISKRALLNVMILLSVVVVAHSDEFECVYTMYVKTGSIIKAGTDSKITLDLWEKSGDGIRIKDIEKWGGLMGANWDYFERSNLDVFSGRGPCLSGPVCAIKVISDGSGAHHGWYLDYVQVTTTGPHKGCAQQTFEVEQWLADDVSPYELFAERNKCYKVSETRPTDVVTNLRSISSS